MERLSDQVQEQITKQKSNLERFHLIFSLILVVDSLILLIIIICIPNIVVENIAFQLFGLLSFIGSLIGIFEGFRLNKKSQLRLAILLTYIVSGALTIAWIIVYMPFFFDLYFGW